MPETAVKSIQTAVSFIPPPYGLVFGAVFKFYDFAISFGRPDPIAKAFALIAKQIQQIEKQLGHVNDRLNDLNNRIANIENRASLKLLQEINSEAKRLAFAISLRPDDGFARRLIAFEAQALADRFLEEPEVWQWTDVAVVKVFDEQGKHLRTEKTALHPDFKLVLAFPAYLDAIFLWIAAIDLVAAGDPPTVRQLFGPALMRHADANLTRYGWVDNKGQPPETLAEQVRARIDSEVSVLHKYSDKEGKCSYGIVAVNRMDHTSRMVGEVDMTKPNAKQGSPNFGTLCTWPSTLAVAYEKEAEDDYGVALMGEISEALKQVHYGGSLRRPYIGRFAMSPAPVAAYLLGITEEGEVDWHFQMVSDGPANWQGPRRTRKGWRDYVRMIPAGGGCFYGLAPNGNLDWFGHAATDWQTGGTNWSGPKPVGKGWGSFAHIVPAGHGVLYAVTTDGAIIWYKHEGVRTGIDKWSGPVELRKGFEIYLRLLSCGAGTIYGIGGNGDLVWHRHDGWQDGSNVWASRRKVGTEWQNFRDVFGSMEGAIYALNSEGQLLRYVHDGWKAGDDKWTNPNLVAFSGYRQIVADMDAAFVGPK